MIEIKNKQEIDKVIAETFYPSFKNLKYPQAVKLKNKFVEMKTNQVLKEIKSNLVSRIKQSKYIQTKLQETFEILPEQFKLVYGFDDDFRGDDDYYIYSILCELQQDGNYNITYESISGEYVTLNHEGKVVDKKLQKEYTSQNQFLIFVKRLFEQGYDEEWCFNEFKSVPDGYSTISFALLKRDVEDKKELNV